MSQGLHLVIATPERAIIDADHVRAVRASDASGSFGILPRHADLLTVLPASVVRWRDDAGALHYCAVRGAVLTVTGGREVALACRQAQLGDQLDALEATIVAARGAETDADRRARVDQLKLHARAARQLARYLLANGSRAEIILPDEER